MRAGTTDQPRGHLSSNTLTAPVRAFTQIFRFSALADAAPSATSPTAKHTAVRIWSLRRLTSSAKPGGLSPFRRCCSENRAKAIAWDRWRRDRLSDDLTVLYGLAHREVLIARLRVHAACDDPSNPDVLHRGLVTRAMDHQFEIRIAALSLSRAGAADSAPKPATRC
jgi:hypothetical protein